MSHTGLALQNLADFCSCNVNKMSWKDNRHEVMTVPTHSIKDSFKSYTRKMIAAALDHDQRHSACQHCWDLEDAGSKSPRQQFNQQFDTLVPETDQPKILLIKPGNTCNMACRMCNPATSTSWYADAHKLSESTESFQQFTKNFEVIRNSYEMRNIEVWNDLKSWMPKLEVIDIYGGEPFLTPGIFDMLQHGVDSQSSKNITVHLNTNASIWNTKYIDILKSYKSVSFKVSVDATNSKQFEYIRHKSKFDQVMANIHRFKNEFSDSNQIHMTVILTVTSLNVFYIQQIQNDLTAMFDLPVGINIVTGPDSYYDIRHLPVPVKQWLVEKSQSSTVNNFLNQVIPGCDIEWPKFCSTTDRLDQIRNQSFKETFPEWWAVLEPYWVSNG
jgi:organic radical activating enzyme